MKKLTMGYVNKKQIGFIFTLFLMAPFVFLSSCRVGTVPYFNNLKDSTNESSAALYSAQFSDPKIMPYDILSVIVQTIDKQTMTVFTEGAKTGGDASNSTAGYMVDADGYIELPVLGRLKVGGLTITQARELVRDQAIKFYIDPAVNIRYANFNVIVLGDVVTPGRKTFPTEKVTILDVIGASGDLQVSGRRENILIIRDEGGHKTAGRVNINSSDIYKSPYYYVRSGDLIYVEPNKLKAKTATTDYTRDRYIAYTTSLLSIFISLYTVIRLR